jgi:hypothetical protein
LAKLLPGISNAGLDIVCRSRGDTSAFDLLQLRQNIIRYPLHWQLRTLHAYNERIALSPFTVLRRPYPTHNQLPIDVPENDTIERLNSLVGFELVPASRINIAADTLNIKDALGRNKNLGLQAQVVDVVIPPWMFAERTNKDTFRPMVVLHGTETSEESSEGRVQRTHLQ